MIRTLHPREDHHLPSSLTLAYMQVNVSADQSKLLSIEHYFPGYQIAISSQTPTYQIQL